MKSRLSCVRWASFAVFSGVLLTAPEANARHGRGGGHGGGHGSRAPRVSAPRGGFKAARMPRINSPARASRAHTSGHSNQQLARSSQSPSHAGLPQNQAHNGHRLATNTSGATRAGAVGGVGPGGTTGSGRVNPGNSTSTRTAVSGRTNALTTAVAGATPTSSSGLYGNGYTYGNGANARQYRAYGYGSGYRNRYYGRGYGYGRSQGFNRAIVGRLRSAHVQLARIDHDYQGHRVRAMHAISMAIRQLSHRSMIYSGVGFAPGMNGRGMGMGMGRGGAGGRGAGRMPQAQSDARMGHALRTLQGINMQSGGQGGYTMGHARARGHIMRAIHELSVALSIR